MVETEEATLAETERNTGWQNGNGRAISYGYGQATPYSLEEKIWPFDGVIGHHWANRRK